MLFAGTFKDKTIEQSFNEWGYASVPSVLNQQELERLLHIYKLHHSHIDSKQLMWNSLYNIDAKKGLAVSEEIKQIIDPILEQVFVDWKFPVATFMSKNPSPDSTCEVHRDFTTLDESRFQFRNIWIPLIDITPENGGLYVVPKSHQLFTDSRPMFSDWAYKELAYELKKHFKTFYPKAGDMIIYADKTLHGSEPNTTVSSRPVIHGGILHKDATLYYYQLNTSENKVKVYEVPFDFYFANEFDSPDLEKKYVLKSQYSYNPNRIRIDDVQCFYEDSFKTHTNQQGKVDSY